MSDDKVVPFKKFKDKLIEREVEKALEDDDELIITVQLDNGLQFFLSLEDDEDEPA